MKIVLLTALLSFLLVGCASTVTPDPIHSDQGAYDSSTPAQYPAGKSGFCQFTVSGSGETTGAVYTPHAITRYLDLLSRYHDRLQRARNVDVKPADGISDYMDQFGNRLKWIDSEHLSYWMAMRRWSLARTPEDSIVSKLSDKVIGK